MRWPAPLVVACVALSGCEDSASTGPTGDATLVVRASTTGGDIDLDGYHLRIDDLGTTLDPIDEQTFTLPAGTHQVELAEVAANCAIQGAATREVDVPRDETVTVAFSVVCGATGVTIQTLTTGLDPDLNGYGIALDGVAYQNVASNASTVLSRLSPGPHTIEITKIAPNCALDGSTSREVTIVNAQLATVVFPVVCQAAWGVIRVNASTSGPDPDGQYQASVVAFPGLATQVNGEGGTILQVPAGSHQVRLDDVAANCTVTGGATREAVVEVGGPVRDTAEVAFTVECVSDSGTIRVEVTTSGSTPGGPHTVYLWSWDCYYCSPVATRTTDPSGSGMVEFTPRSGNYYVTLAPAQGCAASGTGYSEQLTLTVGAVLETQLAATCGPPMLQITAPTSGTLPDAEYSVTLWYYDWWYYTTVSIPLGTLAAGETLSVEAPFPGWFWVSLDGVAANCTVQVQNPSEQFYVFYGVTVELSFPVTCGP